MAAPGGPPATLALAHPLGPEHVLSDPEWNTMDTLLAVLAQDANGDDTYNNERAQIGHLEAKYHMLIDDATDALFTAANEIQVNLVNLGKKNGIAEYLGNHATAVAHRGAHDYIFVHAGDAERRKRCVTKLTALNFAKLREAGLESKSAFVCAALRARWIITGAYSVTKNDTNATYTEVQVVTNADRTYGRIVAATSARDIVNALGKYAEEFKREYQSDVHGMKFISKHAENIWAAVEHCFRVRNHHFKDQRAFKDGFESLYKRYMEAAYEGEFVWPGGVPFLDVFRTAIHPFKLKALPVMSAHYTAHSKIANSSITRMSGASCGCAAITTAVAALDTMRAEAWWPAFERAYKPSIDAAVSFADQINDNKYGYHISAGLYGVEKQTKLRHGKKEISIDEAKSMVSLVASACQGMINALHQAMEEKLISKFALQNAKALEKPASSNPLLALRVTQLVGAALNAIGDADNVEAAIRSALPALSADKRSASTVEDVD